MVDHGKRERERRRVKGEILHVERTVFYSLGRTFFAERLGVISGMEFSDPIETSCTAKFSPDGELLARCKGTHLIVQNVETSEEVQVRSKKNETIDTEGPLLFCVVQVSSGLVRDDRLTNTAMGGGDGIFCDGIRCIR